MSDALEAHDVIERLCKLQAEVTVALNHDGAADCFCGAGGFWGSEGYDGTWEGGYRNDGESLEYIERVVRESLRRERHGDRG